jgi:hypothetical protein
VRAVAVALLAPFLAACQTTLDPNYAIQLESYRLTITSQQNVELARARAEEARYNAMAQIAERSDSATKSMAILALALGGRGNDVAAKPTEVQLPRIPETQEDRALKWASVFAGPTTALVTSYFGYQLGKTQSNNQAQTTQASYAALVAFKPQPVDFTKLPPTSSVINNTTNTTDTNAWITNRDGLVVVGGAQPTSGAQDNSPIAVVPPVVVVPGTTTVPPSFGPGPTFGPN